MVVLTDRIWESTDMKTEEVDEGHLEYADPDQRVDNHRRSGVHPTSRVETKKNSENQWLWQFWIMCGVWYLAIGAGR